MRKTLGSLSDKLLSVFVAKADVGAGSPPDPYYKHDPREDRRGVPGLPVLRPQRRRVHRTRRRVATTDDYADRCFILHLLRLSGLLVSGKCGATWRVMPCRRQSAMSLRRVHVLPSARRRRWGRPAKLVPGPRPSRRSPRRALERVSSGV